MKRKSSLSSAGTGIQAYSGLILKRTPYINESNPSTSTDQDSKPSKSKWTSLKTRSLFGTLMLIGLYIIILIGPPAVVALIAMVQTLVFKEVIAIAHMRSKEKKLPWFRTITWYFLGCTNYFLYGESFAQHFKQYVYSDAFLLTMATHHHFISFCLYIFGMIMFVLNLKRGHYKFQFGQLAFTHMALILIVFQSHFIIRNVFEGLIWFLLPVSLVSCNDIMAYFFGCLFGKTPLIKVSPRKTWEGFLGGFLMTVLFGFFFSGFLARFPRMTCPMVMQWPLASKNFTCEPSYLFLKRQYNLSPFLADLFRLFFGKRIRHVWLYPIQFHSLILSCFASAVAPFGGFFASGFKRAFKLKDFSDSIPGHGGVADRVDCQIVNGLFAYLYLSSFIKTIGNASVGSILETIVKGLSLEDQKTIYLKLQDYLIGQGIIPEL